MRTQRGRWLPSLRREALGYFAMFAFLVAYLLNVLGVGHVVPALLNLSGAGASVLYLRDKNAVPTVISNLAWAAITIAGLVTG
ncbi:MAG: hypothetical protein ABR575_02475 [Actinomycetota bacterium]